MESADKKRLVKREAKVKTKTLASTRLKEKDHQEPAQSLHSYQVSAKSAKTKPVVAKHKKSDRVTRQEVKKEPELRTRSVTRHQALIETEIEKKESTTIKKKTQKIKGRPKKSLTIQT